MAHDVEQLIRRPILASIYASTVRSVDWRPESEYEVIEAFWNSVDDPIDLGALRALAGTLKDDDGQYPWPAERMLGLNISDSIRRLIDAGWLKYLGDGTLAIWHQRLAAWALAEALSFQFQQGNISAEVLGRVLAACCDNTLPIATRGVQLGYTPMDVLWLVFGQTSTARSNSDYWRLIVAIEETAAYSRHDAMLYERLIGSLGPRAVPHVVRRVKHSPNSEGTFIPRLAAAALKQIGATHREMIAKTACDAVRSEEEHVLEFGLRLTASFPESADLDRLSQVHLTRVKSDKAIQIRYDQQKVSGKALHAAIAGNLSWLEKALQQHEHDPPAITELTYRLLNTVDHEADAIWHRRKEALFRAIPDEKRRCLVHCIHRFRDTPEFDRLENWVACDEEMIGTTALQVLSFVDHVRACQSLSRVPLKQLAFNKDPIGRSLLVGDPQIACDAIRGRMLSANEDKWVLFSLAEDHGDRLDREMMDRTIDWLDYTLVEFQSLGGESANRSLLRPLGIVAELNGRVPLEALRSRSGSDFETRLADFACRRADNKSGWVDHEFVLAQSLLKRIAGAGYTRLTNALLTASSHHSRLVGCEEAIVNPDGRTFKLLHDAAMSDTQWESGDSGFPLVQQRAIDALAALGRNRDLIDAVMKWGAQISPQVSELRAGQPAMIDDDFRHAMELLNRPAHPQHANAILALGQTGRTDMTERIQNLFVNSNCKDDVAFKAMLALEDLGGDFAPVLDRLAVQYRSGIRKFAALKAILKSPELINGDFFLSLLPKTGEYDEFDERILSYLAHRDDTRYVAEEKIRAYLLNDQEASFVRFLDAAEHLDPAHPAERELLWAQTRSPDPRVYTGGTKFSAILRLAKTEKDAAYETALEEFLNDGSDRSDMPDVLMQLDRDRAINDICRGIASFRDKSICRSVGIALRLHEAEAAAKQHLLFLLKHVDWRARRSAAMVAGYLGPEGMLVELATILTCDGQLQVCNEIQLARRALQREVEAAAVIETLEILNPAAVWGTLDCVFRLADPDILTLQRDPLGFMRFLEGASFAMRKYAVDQLEKRRKKIEDDFKSLQGQWERDE